MNAIFLCLSVGAACVNADLVNIKDGHFAYAAANSTPQECFILIDRTMACRNMKQEQYNSLSQFFGKTKVAL